MHQSKFTLAALTFAVLATLAGCGGGGAGDQTLKTKFSSQVTFGDSLSDVGTYAVGAIAQLGGGKFTINGDNTALNPALTGKNWTELMAAQFNLPAPCAAETGLNGTTAGFMVPIVMHAGCFGYAQGGSRVSELEGPGNIANSTLGALTVPVAGQIAMHLAAVSTHKFKGDEMVFVMAGGNDVLKQLADLTAQATVKGNTTFANTLISGLVAGVPGAATSAATASAAAAAIGTAFATENANPAHTNTSLVTAAATAAATLGSTAALDQAAVGALVTAATTAGTNAGAAYATAAGPALVTALATAGSNLVALVKTQILANGANYVTVNNLPDVGSTPSALAASASSKALIGAMVSAFNTQLTNGFAGESRVLLVDVYAVSHDQAINPAPYGLTNVTDTACDLAPAKNPLGSALVCNGSNVKSGDVSHYAYADSVHPTPFNNLLLARYVSEKLVLRGWL